ncbi:hypothetical protein [Pseudodesulfovibrio sediminis]|uniref:Sulfotransferase domain-containing protein n=1 Tax=Pseudodesulfovibrio sediminis TaxID=2810563 RepID=A0ABN6EWX7_9BACT|nr:hypothetical protein [Pseudodesulfovibrio sediminis]BCS89942.1 hypothetical protein PSDVSF_31840 [Pseudodesulfovibrio sediminis]
MAQRLFLHIGLPKTGTSAIQFFLRCNESALREQSIVYVHERIYEAWDGKKSSLNKHLKCIDLLANGEQDILISDEGISPIVSRNPNDILLIKDRYPSLEIKIILYLRRQDLHIESLFNHIASSAEEKQFTWEEYPSRFLPLECHDRINYDYYSWISRLQEVLGKENICVRVYDKNEFYGGSIFTDFIHALNLPFLDEYTIPEKRIGHSLDQRYRKIAAKQYEIFNDRSHVEKNISMHVLYALNESMGFSNIKKFLSVKERNDILEYFRESNTMVAEKILQKKGPLFPQNKMTETPKEDSFHSGELEMIPIVLNKIWFNAIVNIDFSMFIYIKMNDFQKRYHSGELGARKKYRIYKMLNSICKRLTGKSPADTKIKLDVFDQSMR